MASSDGAGSAEVGDELLVRLRRELLEKYDELGLAAEQLVRRRRWAHKGPLPAGAEARDLLHHALAALMAGRRVWPAHLALAPVVVEVMTSELSNLLSSGAANEVVFDDAATRRLANAASAEGPLSAEQMYFTAERCQELHAEAHAAARGDAATAAVLDAVLGGAETPRAIAADTGLAVEVVNGVLRTMRRRLTDVALRWRSA